MDRAPSAGDLKDVDRLVADPTGRRVRASVPANAAVKVVANAGAGPMVPRASVRPTHQWTAARWMAHATNVATKLIRGGMDKQKAKIIGNAAARKKCGK